MGDVAPRSRQLEYKPGPGRYCASHRKTFPPRCILNRLRPCVCDVGHTFSSGASFAEYGHGNPMVPKALEGRTTPARVNLGGLAG